MKATKKRKLKVINIGKPTFDDIPLSDLEVFYKNLLKHILEEKETDLKEKKNEERQKNCCNLR